MTYNFTTLVLLFMMYSFMGWFMEVMINLVDRKKFVNRGFLIGPICPIYGWGCLALILLLSKYKEEPLLLFVMAIVICSVLEYFTSYFMELIFKARWWDYSKKKFNINGRICLETMLPFGILGTIVIYIINPFFFGIINKIPQNIQFIIAITLLCIYVVDNIISVKIIDGFKTTLKKVEKDNTIEISNKVKDVLFHKGFLYKRLIKAFPNVKNDKDYLIELKEEITNKLNKKTKDKN